MKHLTSLLFYGLTNFEACVLTLVYVCLTNYAKPILEGVLCCPLFFSFHSCLQGSFVLSIILSFICFWLCFTGVVLSAWLIMCYMCCFVCMADLCFTGVVLSICPIMFYMCWFVYMVDYVLHVLICLYGWLSFTCVDLSMSYYVLHVFCLYVLLCFTCVVLSICPIKFYMCWFV
jgi:hypothetical protein